MPNEFSVDFPEFVRPACEVWEENAEWWDDRIGSGNDYQNYLIEPPTERLLDIQPGEEVLDIACGAGRFARRMAALGARVCAIDQSARFIQRACRHSQGKNDRVQYQVMDAADPAALAGLGEGRFDAAVCTMALMDMPCITPLAATLPKLLKPRGRFVFSIMHPAFSSGTAHLFTEETLQNERSGTVTGVKITGYHRPFMFKAEGVAGQPVPQYYFHRPLDLLLNAFFQYGWALDALVESTFPPDLELNAPLLSFTRARSLPPVLVGRLRGLGEGRGGRI